MCSLNWVQESVLSLLFSLNLFSVTKKIRSNIFSALGFSCFSFPRSKDELPKSPDFLVRFLEKLCCFAAALSVRPMNVGLQHRYIKVEEPGILLI